MEEVCVCVCVCMYSNIFHKNYDLEKTQGVIYHTDSFSQE